MKAILIDPHCINLTDGGVRIRPDEAVIEIEIEQGIDAIYSALSHPEMPVTTFDVVHLGQDVLYVDDEGLLKQPERWFLWKDYPQPLAGRGLIVGSNDAGEDVDVHMTVERVKSLVILGFSNLEYSPEYEMARVLPQVFPRFYSEGWKAA